MENRKRTQPLSARCEKARALLREALEYISAEMYIEAEWMFRDTLPLLQPDVSAALRDDVDKTLSAFPQKMRKELSALVPETAPATAAKPEPDAAAKLKTIVALQQKPDRVAEAFARMAALMDSSEAAELTENEENIRKAIQAFLPKKRKQLLDALEAKTSPPQQAADEDDLDFTADILVCEIEELLRPRAGDFDSAFELFGDVLNALDSAAVAAARDRFEAIAERFDARRKGTLIEMLIKRAGRRKPPPKPAPAAKAVPVEAPAEEPQPEPASIEERPAPAPPRRAKQRARLSPARLYEDVYVCGYLLTRHAFLRTSRRGITVADMEGVIMNGRNVYAQGAEIFFFGERELKKFSDKRREFQRIAGLHVVCNNGVIITAYKNRGNTKRIRVD